MCHIISVLEVSLHWASVSLTECKWSKMTIQKDVQTNMRTKGGRTGDTFLQFLFLFPQHTLTVRFCPGFRSWGISMENSSFPVMPSFSAFSPSINCNGTIPIPTKFDLWIRSKLSATTALTPYKKKRAYSMNIHHATSQITYKHPRAFCCPVTTRSCLK